MKYCTKYEMLHRQICGKTEDEEYIKYIVAKSVIRDFTPEFTKNQQQKGSNGGTFLSHICCDVLDSE